MPTLKLKNIDFYKIIRLILPALLGVSVMQAGVLIDFVFGSYLPNGSITWLYYSTRLMELPVGIFAIGIATVILPHLARYHATSDGDKYRQVLDWSLRSSLLIGIPASFGLFFLAGPIVVTLFDHGLFNSHDALMTTESTRAFAIGIVGFMLTKSCASGFYAKQNMKLPAIVAGITVCTNIALNFVFVSRYAHAGLALATSLSGILNATLLFSLLIKKKYYTPDAKLLIHATRILISSAVMVSTLVFLTPTVHVWLHSNLGWKIKELTFDCVVGLIAYVTTLYFIGWRFSSIRHVYGTQTALIE